MFDALYDFLDKIGYLHPIHPATTHMPIGLVVGSLFLGATALALSRPPLTRSAYHTLVLALILWLPTLLPQKTSQACKYKVSLSDAPWVVPSKRLYATYCAEILGLNQGHRDGPPRLL